ncbi:stage II sporulation protein R [Carboxydothermus pertinax]|uniref:Stage II sporulation protein R n=1 Tax=Carboxydothermus pertinax TaxID=870242 RepID=A0A1L8CS93_9THEO|nr:stage II sporulation protein R [Carboxydothermus pertinax]GAV21790.1 stage II sporulation protein R [Carboxydothermus pertinax]
MSEGGVVLKKVLSLAVLLLGAYVVFGSFFHKVQGQFVPKVLDTDIVRFHVIAASDSPSDQELKLKLRDEILTYLYPKLKMAKSREETLKILKKESLALKVIARNYLKSQHKEIPITVKIGKFYFPDRSYGEYLVPAGYYDALRIEIGKARGHNWWCILYPRLCFADWGRMEPSHVKTYYLKSLLWKKFKKTVKKG